MIKVVDLYKRYDHNVVLDHISFDIPKGETVGFLGNNGAGKSTTMNIITGYLAPDSGSVSVDGYDITAQPLEVKKRVGYTPENPPIYNELTTEEYLKFVCRLKNVPKDKITEQIGYAMDTLRLSEMRKRLIGHLSRGYKQRVGLAQALLGEPEVLILDEPTVGLDPTQIIDIRNTIKSLTGKHTIVLSSHILHEVADICTRIIMINGGKIVVNDSLENLLNKSRDNYKISIKAASDEKSVSEALKNAKGVAVQESKYNEEEKYTEIIAEASRCAEQNAASAIVSAGIGLIELKDIRPSLEEIFLSHTKDN